MADVKNKIVLGDVLSTNNIGVRLNHDTVLQLNTFFEELRVMLVTKPTSGSGNSPVNIELELKICKLGSEGPFYIIDSEDYVAKNHVTVLCDYDPDTVVNEESFGIEIDASFGAMADQAMLMFNGCNSIMGCRVAGEDVAAVVATVDKWNNTPANNDCDYKGEFVNNPILTLLRYIGISHDNIIIEMPIK